MADLLKKLFAPPTGVAVDGLVVARKSAGYWLVRDRLQRLMTAKSTETWKPGADWVTVQDGRIVARAVKRGKIKEYEVR